MEFSELFRSTTPSGHSGEWVASEASEHCRRKSILELSEKLLIWVNLCDFSLSGWKQFFLFSFARITEKVHFAKSFQVRSQTSLAKLFSEYSKQIEKFFFSCLPFCTPTSDKDVFLSLKSTHKATKWCGAVAVFLSFQSAPKIWQNSKKNLSKRHV